MFWNKKKGDEGLPDLPNRGPPKIGDYLRPGPPTLPEEKIHSLPSFPDSPAKRGFSQSAIKAAVYEDEDEFDDLPELPEFPSEEDHEEHPHMPPTETKVTEMEEWKPKPATIPAAPAQTPRPALSNKPIFVRIDKFKSARESLEIVRSKLGDMEELLKEIKEVNSKEEQELSSWDRDIETIKARIHNIDSEVFKDSY